MADIFSNPTNTITPIALDRVVAKLTSDFSNSAGNAVYQIVPFDDAVYNPNGTFDTANNKYVVPVGGDYQVDLVISFVNNGASSNDPTDVVIRKNGTTDELALRHDISDQINAGGGLTVTLSGIVPGLVAGDELTVEYFDADDIIITQFEYCSLSISQLPVSTVIDPSVTPFDNTGVVDGDVLAWNNANGQYEPTSIPEIDDQAASGYVDIGDTRIQWGSSPSGAASDKTITLPAPFLNSTSYSVTASDTAGQTSTLSVVSKSSTQFVARNINTSGGINGGPFDWQAIGRKP